MLNVIQDFTSMKVFGELIPKSWYLRIHSDKFILCYLKISSKQFTFNAIKSIHHTQFFLYVITESSFAVRKLNPKNL